MQKSNHHVFMEALVRRIRKDDSEFTVFHEEFYRMQAGLAGELKVKNRLADHPFKKDYGVLYNFECINARGFSHQIDALLITAHFVMILEVKQIAGQLSYNPKLHEFSRRAENGSEENLANPFDQAYRHQLFIEEILEQHNIQIPVKHLVVIANYRAKLDPSLESMPIIHLSGLPNFLENLFEQFPATNHSPKLLQTLFEKMRQPLPARRDIEPSRLKSGVFCSNCDTKMAMLFYHGYWRCTACHFKSREVLLPALHDYRVLIGPQISNSAFRKFTGIGSTFAASRILSELDLQTVGHKKGRHYIIPDEILWINMD